jgi:hypothetical protein
VWDDEIDGVSLGWNVELRGLAHYLTHHRGRRRRMAWAHVSLHDSLERVWQTLTSPSGAVASGYRPDLAAGDPCTLVLTTGDIVDGRVVFARPGRQLLIAASTLGDALFRLSVDRAAGEAMIQVWLSTWTLDDIDFAALEQRFRSVLGGLAESRATVPRAE